MKNRKNMFSSLHNAVVLVALLAFTFAEAVAQTNANSLLWKVEGKGMQTSYVFGTIHLLPQSQFEMKDKVLNAMDQTKILALEIDMSDPSLAPKMMQMAAMTDGTTLDKLLDKPTYMRLDTMLQQTVGASIMFVNGFKPFVVGTLLISRLIEGQPASFELSLIQEAKSREIAVKGLETLEDQMAVFERIPYASQAKDLAEMVNDESDMKAMYGKMVELYRKEQLDALYDMLVSYMDNPAERDELLGKRNRNWVPLMQKWSAEQPVMYAVGAGHLAGKDGVLQLLRDAGYRVTPVM